MRKNEVARLAALFRFVASPARMPAAIMAEEGA